MVYIYQVHSDTGDEYSVIIGKDKYENDLLIKYGYRSQNLVWFHTDKYSSGHVYLKLHSQQKSIKDVPKEIIECCLQLCKSRSIKGNKLPQCTIITTPWHNLRKAGYMKPGEVSFKKTNGVTKIECFARDNRLLNKLGKSYVEIREGVEEILREAKESKQPEFLMQYVNLNKEKLLEEARRLKAKKKKKKTEGCCDDQLG